jgi:4-hydroxy-tetrahydrodipicolinate reductase
VVVGTTGLGQAEQHAIEQASETVPIVWAANMSLGMNVLFGLVRQAAHILGDDYDVEVVEAHHRQKKDAPSGSALALAGVLTEALARDPKSDLRHGRIGNVGARGPREIGVHAVRGGDIVGDHTVYFCGMGERLELTHRASSRETFARGALRAAEWLRDRDPGLYDMQDVLGLRAAK